LIDWLIVALRHFLTGFITPRTRSVHVPRKLFTFTFLSLDIMVYISFHNLVKFLLLLIHIFSYVLFSVPLVAFLVSFHLKTGFPLPWDHMLCISSRVNAVAHCMLAKHADTFTHVSQSIWEGTSEWDLLIGESL
jgi:hypothetical protein